MMTERVIERDDSNSVERQGSADLDLEMALLAVLASRDMGEATERVRLDTLSPVDKEVLLQLIRGKLGLSDNVSPGDEELLCAQEIETEAGDPKKA